VANEIADHKVSNTHRHAIRFDIDRMKATPRVLRSNTKAARSDFLQEASMIPLLNLVEKIKETVRENEPGPVQS
jgi:hypothetical protein